MTSSESTGAEPAWTSGQAVTRRKALTDAGMERPVAETLVDVLDEQAAPMMTRAEADARFGAMLERHDMAKAEADARFAAMLERHDMAKAEADARFAAMLERDDARFAQHRAEINACFAEFKGHMDARFASVEARFGSVEARFGSVEARFGSVEARFGTIEGQIAAVEGQIAAVEARITGLAGQVNMLKWTFGSFMAFITLLLGLLAFTMASVAS
ncbi:MAG: hypothetical protein F4Y77_18470 [Holophagales bacterium]|nr:hypothetical protein [Holophagales bacterium]